MAYDSNRRVTVLFGGDVGVFELMDDTWEWDGVSWRQMPVEGAPARFRHGMAFDSGRDVIVVFGGEWPGFRDTWEYGCSRIILEVDASCPRGGPIQLSWDGATPNGQIALIFASDQGSFTIPNNLPCAGTPLGLSGNQIQVAYRGGAGADGSRTINANAGGGACGGYLQLLDLSSCGTSNVAAIQ